MDIALVLSRGVLSIDNIDTPTKMNCDSALQLYKDGKIKHFILVGGIFQPDSIQKTDIASLMKNYFVRFLEKLGVSELFLDDMITCEKQSLDTWQNVEFMDQIIRNPAIWKYKIDKIFICADNLHSVRVEKLLRHYGYTNIERVKSKIKLDIKTILKEIILIIMTYMDPSGKGIWSWKLRKERMQRSQGKRYLEYK